MADKTLSQVIGSGGGSAFVAHSIPQFVTLNGVGPGNILSVTPPAGQRVKITRMSTDAASGNAGINVMFDSRTVISAGVLSNYSAETGDWFWVDENFNPATATDNQNGIFNIVGDINEEFNLNISGTVAANIFIRYEVGE